MDEFRVDGRSQHWKLDIKSGMIYNAYNIQCSGITLDLYSTIWETHSV